MYYNIVLNGITGDTDPKGFKIIKSLACENIDLIEMKAYPVVVCRYANEEECKFFKELSERFNLDLSFREIKPGDNVFNVFHSELKQGEQEDIHLKSRPEIINKLLDGVDILKERNDCYNIFSKTTETISEKIRERNNNKTKTFKPKTTLLIGSLWILISVLLFLVVDFNMLIKACVLGGVAVCLIAGLLIYEYKNFVNQKKYYASKEYEHLFISEIVEQNHRKNMSIYRIENLIDSLKVRHCLTLLPTEQRELEIVEKYLIQLNTLKSINEIFCLQ